MNAKMMEFLFSHRDGKSDVSCERSVEGVVVPRPVIFESEILGEIRTVLYWHGDDEGSKQREFPLCMAPGFFNRELAADSKCCDIQFVGSLASLPGGRHGVGRYQVGCHRKDLEEETPLVCGTISGMTFIFETVLVADPDVGVIAPKLYLKEERMSPGGVELEF